MSLLSDTLHALRLFRCSLRPVKAAAVILGRAEVTAAEPGPHLFGVCLDTPDGALFADGLARCRVVLHDAQGTALGALVFDGSADAAATGVHPRHAGWRAGAAAPGVWLGIADPELAVGPTTVTLTLEAVGVAVERVSVRCALVRPGHSAAEPLLFKPPGTVSGGTQG